MATEMSNLANGSEITALAASKLTGALPAISGAALTNLPSPAPGANSVGQSQLKSTTATQSVSVPKQSCRNIVPTGGTYSFYHIPYGGSDQYGTWYASDYCNTSTGMGFGNANQATRTCYLTSRYIQASPPYNLGDGDIPLFVYVLIDNTTLAVEGVSVATDPHWAYNGDNLLVPDRIDPITKIKYKNVPQFVAEGIDLAAELKSNDSVRRNIAIDMMTNKIITEVEIDHAYQNKNMNVAPHCWDENDLAGKTVALLDPSSEMMLELYEIHKQDGYVGHEEGSIVKLIEDGYIVFDTTPLTRTMPIGVVALSCRWSNTGATFIPPAP
jgi:hypothetical protein